MNESTHQSPTPAVANGTASNGTPERATPGSESPAPSKVGIGITQSAVDAVGAQIAKRNVPGTALRVGIRGGGCSGFSYVIEFHDGPPHERDHVVDRVATDGSRVRVLIDPKSLLYLNGS